MGLETISALGAGAGGLASLLRPNPSSPVGMPSNQPQFPHIQQPNLAQPSALMQASLPTPASPGNNDMASLLKKFAQGGL